MDKLIVMSLEDENSKQLAKVLGNDTALKMLNKLAEKRCSASELSKQLNIPISTIQYNLELLVKSNMIKETAYRYSEKGKKVPYYEPMKKLIVIAPENEKSSVFNILKDKFLIPIALGVTALFGFGVQSFLSAQQTKEVVQAPMAETFAKAGAPISSTTLAPFYQEPWFIFFLGALFVTAIFLIAYKVVKK